MAGGVPAGRLNIEIVAEIARLQADLDKAKKLVNAASGDIAKSARAANDNLAGLGSGLNKAGNSSKLAGHHTRNLAFQFQDLGVQMAAAAQSSEPFKMAMMAVLQQGAQIQGIMSQAGIGVKGLIGAFAGMLAPFAPIIAAVAALGAGVALVTSEINKNSKVTVTWQDTLLGTFDAISAYVGGKLTDVFGHFGTTTAEVWKTVAEWGRWAVNRIIGVFTVLPRTVLDNLKLIPAGVADAFFSAVNIAIDAINSLIKKSADGVNGFINSANVILSKAGLSLPTVTAPQIAKVANSYKGAGIKLGAGLAKSIGDTMSKDFIGAYAGMISPFAQKRTRDRAAKDAKGAGSEAGRAMGKEMGDKAVENLVGRLEQEGLTEFYSQFLKEQEQQWKEFGETLDRVIAANFEYAQIEADNARKAADQYAESLRDIIGLMGNMGAAGEGIGALFGVLTGNTKAIGGPIGNLLNIGIGFDAKGMARTIGDELSSVFEGLGKDLGATIAEAAKGAGIGMAAGDILGKQTGTQRVASAIGGAVGKELGSLAGPLGGVIGSVAGGILGSVVGGIFKTTRSASANITGANSVSVNGKDTKQYGAATDLAGSVTSGLKQIADAFGAQLGAFQVAIGTRGDEIRVNTSGSSLKTGAGAKGFGEDAEAAARYAILDAINDGALKGMREGSLRLLKAGDDLDAALQKATSFENVFAELRNVTDPTGAALDQLDKQFAELRTIFEEAGASAAEYADLEKLLSIRREEVLSKERDALDDIRSRIAEVQGDDDTVRAIERQRELKDAMSDIVRVELERLYAIEDATRIQQEATLAAEASAQAAAQAQQELAAAQAEAAETALRLAEQRRGLEIQLMEAQGNATGALAARRADELAALDASLRALQEQVWAAQDAATAQDKLAQAQADAAASAAAAADRMNSLQIRLYNAQGNSAAATKLQQQLELQGAQTDAEKAMLQKIYAAEAAAAKAAAAAERRAAAQQKAEQIANARNGLQLDLLRALGKGEEALALERKIALEAMDKSLRPLQQQVWAAQEAAATADKFRDFGKTLREFREGLIAGDKATADAYRTAQVAFMTTSALAKAGDEAAIGKLSGVSQTLIDVARDRAGSYQDVLRAQAMVLQGIDDTLDYTDGQVDVAERQLDAIAAGNNIQREVRDALAELLANNSTENQAIKGDLSAIRRALTREEPA